MSTEPAAGEPRFTALVLAGSRGPDDPVARHCGVEHKCLAAVRGAPMLAYVLKSLAASSSIGRIFVSVADPAILQGLSPAANCVALTSGASPSSSVLQALGEVSHPLPLLITTADHPLLSATMVDWFCAATRESERRSRRWPDRCHG